jgi:hypothetical protein
VQHQHQAPGMVRHTADVQPMVEGGHGRILSRPANLSARQGRMGP